MQKKKIWANFQRIIELFTQKIVTKLSKIWVRDPGSGKNLFRMPGSKRHLIPDPQHCELQQIWTGVIVSTIFDAFPSRQICQYPWVKS